MSFISDVLTNLPGIGQVAGIMSNIWNTSQQTKINEQNLAFAREQATTAFERQNQLLDKQNAYNDPKAQMQRYVDAGLNPNLIYGTPNLSAAVPSVATGSPGNSIAPQIDPSQFANIKQTEKSADLTVAQFREILGDTPLSKAKIEETLAHAEYLRTMTDTVAYTAGVERFKRALFDDELGFELADEDGNLRNISKELREQVYNNSIDALKADNSEYQLAIKSLAFRIAGEREMADKIKLENDDLRAWVEFCGDIYEASADEAKLASTIAKLDKQFYDNFDLGKSGMDMTFYVLTSLIKAFAGMATKPLPAPAKGGKK